MFASLACCAPVIGALTLWIWLAVDRIWAGIKSRECEYLCCGNCLQDLRGLAEMGQCPECGEPYSAPVLIAAWKEIDGVPEIGN